MTDTTLKSAALESEAFLEASKMPATEQQGTLIGKDSSIFVPSASQATSPTIKINKDSGSIQGQYSNVVELSINESFPIDSQMVASASEVGDNPTMPLILSRAEDVTSSTNWVDDRIYASPPSERTPLIECMRCCFIINYNRPVEVEQLGNSKYILLALVPLLAIPLSSIYFGVIYKDSCSMAKYSPVLLIAMGVVGVISIVFRLLTVSIRKLLWNMKKPSKAIQPSLIFMLTVLMIIEMVSFYTQKPVFEDPRDPAFCEKTFYDYVFYMNFAVLIIGILALFLYIPRIPCSTQQMLPQ